MREVLLDPPANTYSCVVRVCKCLCVTVYLNQKDMNMYNAIYLHVTKVVINVPRRSSQGIRLFYLLSLHP